MKRRALSAALAGLLLAAPHVARCQDKYLTGGVRPLPPELQRQLDAHAANIRLGINTAELEKAQVDPIAFVQAAIALSDAIESGCAPGAVFRADTLWGDTMPIAVGSMMTDPEVRPAEWSTLYEVGTLTGPMTVVPLAMRAVERGELSLKDPLRKFFPALRKSDKGAITVEMLLRHTAGFPAQAVIPEDVRTRGELFEYIRTLPLMREPGVAVERSGLNFLMLGLILESMTGVPIREQATRDLFRPIGMMNTPLEMPVQWRASCAPGPYSRWHGRMAWGEAAEPSAFLLGTSAANGGLVTNADDLSLFSKFLLVSYAAGSSEFCTSETMRAWLEPDPSVQGGETQGLGWTLGGMGEGSFGWDSDSGASLWIVPYASGYVLYLSNRSHPHDPPMSPCDARAKVFFWLAQSFVRPKGPEA